MMDLQTIAQAVSGTHQGANPTVGRICTDSRAMLSGDLFVALSGSRFDGHDFVEKAIDQGAAGLLIEREMAVDCPSVAVADTHRALGQLAHFWRCRFEGPVVAVTGSNGKTTVKELIGQILTAGGRDALVSAGNFNNAIGLPLSLLRLRPRHCAAVVEIGMSQTGEIDALAKLAVPNVAVITNAGAAHLECLKSVQQVAVEKGSLLDALSLDGVAILNHDDAHFEYWQARVQPRRAITFGLTQDADISARCSLRESACEMEVSTPAGSADITLNFAGLHNVANALAAIAAGTALNIPLDQMQAGLQHAAAVRGRLEFGRHKKGGCLIDDTYNANPESMQAAISVLAKFSGDRRLVMGDMLELGDGAGEYHRLVGEQARAAGIGRLYALGEYSPNAVTQFGRGARHYSLWSHLAEDLLQGIDSQTTVLVKGSRGMQMERIVNQLRETESKEEASC